VIEEQQSNGTLVPIQQRQELSPHTYEYDYYGGGHEAPEGDWQRIMGLLWRGKWWILIATVLGTGAGYFAARLGTERVFVAQSTVYIEEQDNRRGPIRAEEIFQGEGWRDVLRSYAVLEPVVVERGLYLTHMEPESAPSTLYSTFSLQDVLTSGVYTLTSEGDGSWTLMRDGEVVSGGTAADPIGTEAGFLWQPSADDLRAAGGEISFQLRRPRVAAANIRGKLQVIYDRNSGLITSRLRWEDPREASSILNQITDKFIQTATDLKNQKQREVVQFLEEQTGEAAAELAASELALERFKVQTVTLPGEREPAIPGMLGTRDPVFSAYFQRRLDAEELRAGIALMQEMLAVVRQTGEVDIVGLQLNTIAQSSGALQAALDQYSQREVDKRTLMLQYTSEYPDVVRIEGELAYLRTETIPALIEDLIGQSQTRLESYRGQLEAQEEQLQRIPTRTIEETRLTREFQMAEQLHNTLLLRLREAQLAEATNALPDMQILDRASPPHMPESNRGPQLIMFAAMVGAGLGVGGILLHDRLDKRIRHPEQVSRGLGLPVLGIVPEMSAKRLRSASHAAMAIESFRAIRTQIAHSAAGSEGVLMVTSPAPREGKSTVSANLAISYAMAGRRTIFIDGDTRRGRGHEMFGISRGPGLTDYLLERAEWSEAVYETDVADLAVVPSGHLKNFNAELLNSERMRDLLGQLKTEYDVVLFDGPPLAAGADALVLGEQCDKVLMILRAGTSDEKLARAKLDMIGNVDLPIIGAVLNALPKSAPYHDYYVSYYYADADVVEPVAS
jgi:tyrosine-protein kinase Etk/Wzc